MSNDKPSTNKPSKKRATTLSNGLPEVFMADRIKRGATTMRVDPPKSAVATAASTQDASSQ